MSVATFAHAGQNRLHDRDRAEHIDRELVTQFSHRRLFERAFQPVASVRDEHVDRAEVALDLGHRRNHGSVVGDVEEPGVGTAGCEPLKVSGGVARTDGADDPVASG